MPIRTDDHPLGAVRAAFSSMAGSIVLSVCASYAGLMVTVVGMGGEWIAPWDFPGAWLITMLMGVFQGWGVLTYGVLLALFIWNLQQDFDDDMTVWPKVRTLLLVVAIQAGETYRAYVTFAGQFTA